MEDGFEEETFLSDMEAKEENYEEDESGLSPEEEGFLKGYNEALENDATENEEE